VWGCQIKIDNTAIIHSVRLTGYPATWNPGTGDKDEEGNIKYNTGFVFAPRPLFPKYFLPAVNHPLNTQLKAAEESTRQYYSSQLVSSYKNFKNIVKFREDGMYYYETSGANTDHILKPIGHSQARVIGIKPMMMNV
jgi:hypothetical protein